MQRVIGGSDGSYRFLELPDADAWVMPGVRWGAFEHALTPAFWVSQAWLEGTPEVGFQLCNTLTEEVVTCLLGGHGAPAEVGLPVLHRPAPSAGGLHPFSFICVADVEGRVVLYDASVHGFRDVQGDTGPLLTANKAQLTKMLGTSVGVTIRFVCDRALVDAAYAHPASLILRDAGALLATVALIAEWLGLSACPLGFLGDDFITLSGLPGDRFVGAGGIQISA